MSKYSRLCDETLDTPRHQADSAPSRQTADGAVSSDSGRAHTSSGRLHLDSPTTSEASSDCIRVIRTSASPSTMAGTRSRRFTHIRKHVWTAQGHAAGSVTDHDTQTPASLAATGSHTPDSFSSSSSSSQIDSVTKTNSSCSSNNHTTQTVIHTQTSTTTEDDDNDPLVHANTALMCEQEQLSSARVASSPLVKGSAHSPTAPPPFLETHEKTSTTTETRDGSSGHAQHAEGAEEEENDVIDLQDVDEDEDEQEDETETTNLAETSTNKHARTRASLSPPNSSVSQQQPLSSSSTTTATHCPPSSSASSSSSTTATTTPRLYSCDVCHPHHAVLFTSMEELRAHALREHRDQIPEYAALRAVAQQLIPLWTAVRARKRDTITACGEHVFRVAQHRDAGPVKMAEAHCAREQLEVVVRRWRPHVRVYIFGSSVAFGVWDGVSDIDFTVVDVAAHESGAWPPPERNAVRSIAELLRRAGFAYANIDPIGHARVPIIKHHASQPIRLTGHMDMSTMTGSHTCHDELDVCHAAGASEQQVEVVVSHSDTCGVNSSVATPVCGGNDTESVNKVTTSEPMKAHASCVPPRRRPTAAESVIRRSVRYLLSEPATMLDRVLLEASVREALGTTGSVQQVWWNRTRDVMSLTCDTTTHAMIALTCPLRLHRPQLRVRVEPLHEECRPELYHVDFDLSFRVFGIRNSLLLRRYLTSHPCARPGALVLKDWSKSSGVNNSVNGYLTSYAINIMWIYFLVQKGVVPYVDPLDDIPSSLQGNQAYSPEYCPMVDGSWTAPQRQALYAQAGELLLGFFYFYANEFDWDHHVVSLNRSGITTKAMLDWDVEDMASSLASSGPHRVRGGRWGAASNAAHHLHRSAAAGRAGGESAAEPRRRASVTRYTFCIEDPYEDNLNLGRHMGVTKALRVQTELCRALLSLLKDRVQDCCVFSGTSPCHSPRAASAANQGESVVPHSLGQKELSHTIAESGLSRAVGQGSSRVPPHTHLVGDTTITSSSAAAAAGANYTSSAARLLQASHASHGPEQLPLSVIWRLMSICTRHMAQARRRLTEPCRTSHTAETSAEEMNRRNNESSSVRACCDGVADPGWETGVDEKVLQEALRTQAPLEYGIACKVWNWHQLVHRLGYVVHRGRVRWRREIGDDAASGAAVSHACRTNYAHAVCTMSVTGSDMPTITEDVEHGNRTATNNNSSSSSSNNRNNNDSNIIISSSSSNSSSSNASLDTDNDSQTAFPYGLTADVVQAVHGHGFMALRPEWVAWSRPWACQRMEQSHDTSLDDDVDEEDNDDTPGSGGKDSAATDSLIRTVADRMPDLDKAAGKNDGVNVAEGCRRGEDGGDLDMDTKKDACVEGLAETEHTSQGGGDGLSHTDTTATLAGQKDLSAWTLRPPCTASASAAASLPLDVDSAMNRAAGAGALAASSGWMKNTPRCAGRWYPRMSVQYRSSMMRYLLRSRFH